MENKDEGSPPNNHKLGPTTPMSPTAPNKKLSPNCQQEPLPPPPSITSAHKRPHRRQQEPSSPSPSSVNSSPKAFIIMFNNIFSRSVKVRKLSTGPHWRQSFIHVLGCRHFNSIRDYDICNLHDFTRSPSSYNKAIFGGQHSIRTAKGKISVELLRAMRGMVRSLFSGQFQGNLNPRNMWICVEDGSIGGLIANLTNCTLDCNWNAPEQHLGGELTSKTDLFMLGCIIFYCITGGIHPFGKDLDQRRKNVIQNNPVNLSQLKDMPEAYHLISRLLNPEPKLRPRVSVVENHPLFWSPLKRLQFLVRIWEHAFSKDILMDEDDRELLLETLKKKAPSITDPKWGVKAQCIEERCNYLVQLFYDRCPRSYDENWILNSFPPLLDLQDVVGPRRSRTSGYYQRLLVNAYEAVLEVDGVRGWKEDFWWV